jgi:hypothetical protein
LAATSTGYVPYPPRVPCVRSAAVPGKPSQLSNRRLLWGVLRAADAHACGLLGVTGRRLTLHWLLHGSPTYLLSTGHPSCPFETSCCMVVGIPAALSYTNADTMISLVLDCRGFQRRANRWLDGWIFRGPASRQSRDSEEANHAWSTGVNAQATPGRGALHGALAAVRAVLFASGARDS